MGSKRRKADRGETYAQFAKINGRHPFRRAVPKGYVDYAARRLRGSDVVYFNFALAREMGLISKTHPDRLNRALRRAILETFSLVIINEYDQKRKASFRKEDLLPNRYMATRYLQMQHPDRKGRTSGDGRSVWNGTFTGRGTTWDISSCGTGVTRLCPATAEQNRFFKTGGRTASYGCGTASIEDGLAAALMSETFHLNGIGTERVLAVIELANGFAINVRAGRNLLRPSHFFVYSRQDDLESLRAIVEHYFRRQVRNGIYPSLRRSPERYRFFTEEMARTLGRIAATFEREYIFCWLDWDGDNILADGGIIDYGSVRQFGLFHREYRFDDGPMWSTTISEQRRKARLIVQNFVQIREYLLRGKKPRLESVGRDKVLALFDAEFESTMDRLLLRNIGFEPEIQEALSDRHLSEVRAFSRSHAYFEHARSARGPRKVEDGICWNAIFSTRDLLRELPRKLFDDYNRLPATEFMKIALSTYASARDRKIMPYHRRMAARFQREYIALIEAAARISGQSIPLLLSGISGRSSILNRFDRITGDASTYAAQRLCRNRRRLCSDEFHDVIRAFLLQQVRVPERRLPEGVFVPKANAKRVFDGLLEMLAECRHGL